MGAGQGRLVVHLVDGTYELFRQHFGRPSHARRDGQEVAAVRGVLADMVGLLESGARYIGVATDHRVESFRNTAWPQYKSSAGMPADLLSQFPILEEALAGLGLVVWPMVELEADDALASAAAVVAADPRVGQVRICTPDKDLAQCVDGTRVVQVDRRRRPEAVADEDAVRARFGVGPRQVPDWLALVGDSSDGYPGLRGWGPKSATAVLARYRRLEEVPDEPGRWDVAVRGVQALAAELAAHRHLAMLFRDLATLRVDATLLAGVDDLAWEGPEPGFAGLCEALDAPGTARRAHALARSRG